MSGCHPTNLNKRADCIACNGGVWGSIYPPQCTCNLNFGLPIPKETLEDIREEEDVSPMIKRIQELEEKISYLERNSTIAMQLRDQHAAFNEEFSEYRQDNGSWKLAIKGDIVSLNKCYLELEKKLNEITSTVKEIDCDMSFVPTFEAIRVLEQKINDLEAFEEDGDYAINDLRDRVSKLESSNLNHGKIRLKIY